MDKSYLTEAEAAEFLAISQKTLQRWRFSGRPPRYAKFGGAVRYAISDLRDYASTSLKQPFSIDSGV